MEAKNGKSITRRGAIGLAAGTIATALTSRNWVFALNEAGAIVKKASDVGADGWKPVLFDEYQAEAVARLCETLIPRTETPGSRDARVHEYIDLAVSLAEPAPKKSFLDGFSWLDKKCRKLYKQDLVAVEQSQLEELLHSISDEHEDHPRKLRKGVAFFEDLKERTIFGYYTSEKGRVEDLGLPEAVGMEKWRGCRHRDSQHG